MERPLQSTLAEKAYEAIRTMLSRGELRPGDRLVNRSLAEKIGISFTPVREAINQLASEGLVEYVRGAGAFVRRIDRKELEQLFDLRVCLETFAMQEAARHISSADLADAYSLCSDFYAITLEVRRSPGQVADRELWSRWIAVEERFHGLIMQAAQNSWLLRIAGELQLMALLFGPQRAGEGILTLRTAAQAWRQHLDLVRSLEQGSADRGAELMRQHIETARRRILGWHDSQVRAKRPL